MYTYELSPIATVIEQTIVKRMCQMVGFPDGFGTFTTGGSNGNMLGMLCAREQMISGSTKRGFDGRSTVIFVSAEAHYSVLMAANVIGIGHQNIIKVQCDEDGRMRPDRLEEEISFARQEGMRPLCIVATAATTVRGAYDDIDALADIGDAKRRFHATLFCVSRGRLVAQVPVLVFPSQRLVQNQVLRRRVRRRASGAV